jgi:hypothetical protein
MMDSGNTILFLFTIRKHDTVFIYNNSKCIAEKEIYFIMDYLFDEGFIRDRRTKYYVAEKEK